MDNSSRSRPGWWRGESRPPANVRSSGDHRRTRDARPARAGEIKLSEVIAALSYALDITEGQPEGHAIKTCLIGMRLAEEIVIEVTQHAGIVRFWHNPHAQDELRKQIIHTLDDRDLFPFSEQAAVADKVMELARANQSLIAQRIDPRRRT